MIGATILVLATLSMCRACDDAIPPGLKYLPSVAAEIGATPAPPRPDKFRRIDRLFDEVNIELGKISDPSLRDRMLMDWYAVYWRTWCDIWEHGR